MSLLPLPTQTLAWLKHAADSGQCEPLALLHLIARADAQDQWFTKFTDHYAKTIANLCRQMEALERRTNDLPAPTAPVDDSPVANALLVAESALADVAKGMAVSLRAHYRLEVAHAQCTRRLAVIRRVMKEHGIRTSEFPPAAPAPATAAPGPVEPESEKCETCDGEGTIDETLGGWSTDNPAATCPDCDGIGEPRRLHRQAPATPTPRPTALVEVVGNELPLLPDGRVDEARTRATIHKIAAWLDTRGQHGCSYLLREEIIDQ
jgi:hypothetical protein